MSTVTLEPTRGAAAAPSQQLGVHRATAYYVGALLGPGLLLLPGLAARIAGPASILAWAGLLVLSALLAWMFAALGRRFPGGIAGFLAAGLGTRVARAGSWCFVLGVVCGAPVVCLIGGGYLATLTGLPVVPCAAALLLLVLATTTVGTRASSGAQLVLVGALAALVLVAVVGSAGQWRIASWTPFAPHGWTAVGSAASVLVLAFVGWEAAASLTARLAEPATELPRVIRRAFAITAAIYLSLGGATVAVLGTAAGSDVPLADLMERAVGPAGRAVAAVTAVVLTLAATNAYLGGACELVEASLRRSRRWVPASAALAGVLLLGAQALGLLDVRQLVTVPTVLFVSVYLGVTTSAARVLTGPVRVAAAASAFVVAAVLAFTGWVLLLPVGVLALNVLRRAGRAGA